MRAACLLFSLLVTLTGLIACASREKAIINSQEATIDHKQALLRKKVTALLEKKSYHRAIELVTVRNQPGIPSAGLEKEYLLAVNGLITAGEGFLGNSDYAAAGQSFRWALSHFPVQQALQRKVRRDQPQLKKQLQTCASELLEQGLMEYRSGNLENAIGTWKEITIFDPGHKEALKAIDTATVQLRALQQMEKPRQ